MTVCYRIDLSRGLLKGLRTIYMISKRSSAPARLYYGYLNAHQKRLVKANLLR